VKTVQKQSKTGVKTLSSTEILLNLQLANFDLFKLEEMIKETHLSQKIHGFLESKHLLENSPNELVLNNFLRFLGSLIRLD